MSQMTPRDMSTMLYELALKMPTARAKRYYLKRGDELQKLHDTETADRELRKLVWEADQEIKRAKAGGATYVFIPREER